MLPKSISTKGSPEKQFKENSYYKIFFVKEAILPKSISTERHSRKTTMHGSTKLEFQEIGPNHKHFFSKIDSMKGQCKMANEKTFNEKQQQHNSIASITSVQQQHSSNITATYQMNNSSVAQHTHRLAEA